jgi:hypothetical protein
MFIPKENATVTLTVRQYEAMYWALLQIACGRLMNNGTIPRSAMMQMARQALIDIGDEHEWGRTRVNRTSHVLTREELNAQLARTDGSAGGSQAL